MKVEHERVIELLGLSGFKLSDTIMASNSLQTLQIYANPNIPDYGIAIIGGVTGEEYGYFRVNRLTEQDLAGSFVFFGI